MDKLSSYMSKKWLKKINEARRTSQLDEVWKILMSNAPNLFLIDLLYKQAFKK